MSGTLDDIVLSLSFESLFGYAHRTHYAPVMLPLDYLETEALNQFLCEDGANTKESSLNLTVKHTVYDLPSHERYILEYIQDALETGSALRFLYSDSRGVTEEKRGVQPIHVLRHTAENLYCFFDQHGYIYRFDRIGDIDYDESVSDLKRSRLTICIWIRVSGASTASAKNLYLLRSPSII